MQIFVKSPTGRTFGLNPSDTLSAVKAKIQEQYRHVLDGVQLEENITLADYNVQHMSTLDLQEKMQIYVIEMLAGRTITLEVHGLDTIGNLKAKIEETGGFPMGYQCLIFANKQLEDNHNLADHDIKNESTLLLVLNPLRRGFMWIFVNKLDGSTFDLEVDQLDTIHDVKVKIYVKEGSQPIQQCIIAFGQQLENHHTLAYYNIQKDYTVHLVLCLCGC